MQIYLLSPTCYLLKACFLEDREANISATNGAWGLFKMFYSFVNVQITLLCNLEQIV